MKKKIAILGGGNIGKAIALGLIDNGEYNASDLIVTSLSLDLLDELKEKNIQVSTDNHMAVKQSEVIILSVQPGQLMDLLEDIKSSLDASRHILASVVTAYTIADIRGQVGEEIQLVRVMPNTAISIRKSMTCLASDKKDIVALEELEKIFSYLGTTLVISEKLMAAATILGACGIAFFLRYIRAASQGGIQVGFHAEEAQLIAAQTALGAASLLLSSGSHPEEEIDKVTTPNGCTITGLNEMEHYGLSSAVIKGIITSYNQVQELK